MKSERLLLTLALGAALFVTNVATAQLLTNGDFEMPSILGAGQSEVGLFDDYKLIEIDPGSSFWAEAISGVQFWDNALQFGGPPPSRSDQGIASWEDIVGTPFKPRFAFINNWNRRFNQTVSTLIANGVTYTATIEFATRLDDPSQERAGLFELRAGPMDPLNPDDPGTSILLDSLTAGQSGFYGGADPDVVVTDRVFTMLTLSYTPSGAGDPAIGQPLTVTFRTEFGSQGKTFWDNATLAAGSSNPLGDLNCDGTFNGGDIDPFFLALGDPAAYAIAFPNCNILLGDMNCDGRVDGGDIDEFFRCLGIGGCTCP